MKAGDKAYVSDNDEEFSIYNQDAIALLLQGLVEKRVPLSATFNSGNDVLLTAVLDVDQKEGFVYIDVNANEEFNEHIVVSKKVVFHTFFNGAKIMWTSTAVQATMFEELKAFRVALPERLQRIQRRGSFRVGTPILNPVTCRIPIDPKHEVSMPLFDICIEGIGLVLPIPPEPRIEKFAEFKNCKIEHPDLGEVLVSLFVKSIWEVTLKNGTKAQRAGLEFVDISNSNQAIIQRFVYKMERQLIATSKAR